MTNNSIKQFSNTIINFVDKNFIPFLQSKTDLKNDANININQAIKKWSMIKSYISTINDISESWRLQRYITELTANQQVKTNNDNINKTVTTYNSLPLPLSLISNISGNSNNSSNIHSINANGNTTTMAIPNNNGIATRNTFTSPVIQISGNVLINGKPAYERQKDKQKQKQKQKQKDFFQVFDKDRKDSYIPNGNINGIHGNSAYNNNRQKSNEKQLEKDKSQFVINVDTFEGLLSSFQKLCSNFENNHRKLNIG